MEPSSYGGEEDGLAAYGSRAERTEWAYWYEVELFVCSVEPRSFVGAIAGEHGGSPYLDLGVDDEGVGVAAYEPSDGPGYSSGILSGDSADSAEDEDVGVVCPDKLSELGEYPADVRGVPWDYGAEEL